MKKIERVQIAGHSFFFEDDAFLLLENFIGQIHRLYKDNGEEAKAAEVENRIAEMCLAKVGEGGIVTAAFVDDVISAIGIKIEEPVAEEPASGDEVKNDSDDSEQNATWYKAMLKGAKLFRNQHGNILGGVLSGIAMHYDIDVATLRVITLVLFILPLQIPVLLAYVVLWAVMPKATTIMDYTRMRRVKVGGDNEAVKRAWKKNYEMCIEELSIPADKGCLYSLVRALFFILVALLIMPLGVVVFVFLLALLLFIVTGWGVLEVFNMPFMIFVGIAAVIIIPISLLLFFVLDRANVCKPMKSKTRRFLVALWVIVLLLVAPMVHRYVKDNGGYENLDNIIEYQWDNVKMFFSGDLRNVALMGSSFCYSSGSVYNIRSIDRDCDAVVASAWDAGRENEGLPLIIESVHDSDGKYFLAFCVVDEGCPDAQVILMDEDYDARVEMLFVPGGEINGWHRFMWDSIGKVVYYGDFSYDATGCVPRSVRTEECTSKIKLRTVESLDGVTYDNAREHGLVPFKIFYYGNQRTPSLVIGDEWNGEVEEIASMVKFRGRNRVKIGKGRGRDIKIDKEAAEEIDEHINGVFDAARGVLDASKGVLDVSRKVLDVSGDVVGISVDAQKALIDAQKEVIDANKELLNMK